MNKIFQNSEIDFSDSEHSNSTIANYLKVIRKINSYIAPKQLMDLEQQEVEHLVAQYIFGKGLSASYQNMVITAIKFYYKQIKRQFETEWKFSRPKRVSKQIQFLCNEEIKQMLTCTNNLKNKCILLLLFGTGLKSSQLLALKRNDVNLQKATITIKERQGKISREILIPETLVLILKNYLIKNNPGNYLFEGNYEGEALCERSLQIMIKKIGEKAKIKTAVSANILRNSYAIYMLNKGADIRYVNKQMGHSSLRSTMQYGVKAFKAKTISPIDEIGF